MTWIILAHRSRYPSVTTLTFGPKTSPLRDKRGNTIEFASPAAAQDYIEQSYMRGQLPDGCERFSIAEAEGRLPD